MLEQIFSLSSIDDYSKKIHDCLSLNELDNLRVLLLGKSGHLTQSLKSLNQLSPQERREKGSELNKLRDELGLLLNERKITLQEKELDKRLQTEVLDPTLPIRSENKGTIHLLTQIIQDIQNYFSGLGFNIVKGPEVEDDCHNFDALNIPLYHPARQNHDTFYVNGETSRLLRTHTTTVQIRTLKHNSPPLRTITTGRVYRSDDLDATHTPMFHQLDGFVIEPNIHIGHLKGCLIDFCRYLFQVDDLPYRMRPSFFPFTEPSIEFDICCRRKNGQLKLDKNGQWLEILGGGMIHPQVLKNCGIDANKYQGFAFGVGIERLVMLKYGITDIRQLYESDERWLNHYGNNC